MRTDFELKHDRTGTQADEKQDVEKIIVLHGEDVKGIHELCPCWGKILWAKEKYISRAIYSSEISVVMFFGNVVTKQLTIIGRS